MHMAAKVGPPQVLVRADLQLDDAERASGEHLGPGRIGQATGPRRDHPDAATGVVGEEQPVVVGGREVPGRAVEGHPAAACAFPVQHKYKLRT
jgi:hypothetical protein